MLTLDGALYYAALTFLDATILIPLFLQHVSGAPMLIGLAVAIRQLDARSRRVVCRRHGDPIWWSEAVAKLTATRSAGDQDDHHDREQRWKTIGKSETATSGDEVAVRHGQARG